MSDYLKDYKLRSTGWVQDASDFDNLHRFVSIFSYNKENRLEVIKKINELVDEPLKSKFLKQLRETKVSLTYGDIVGSAPNGSRKENTVCNGIGQAGLKGQKRDFQGDWPTDNFLRWSEVLQFIIFDPSTGEYVITKDGEEFISIENNDDKLEFLTKKLLMYPPVIRILSLLAEGPQNKFTLGAKLGFIGESGFTYISEELFLEKYFSSNVNERKKIKSDFEGSSDKYARQICSWLLKLKLIKTYKFKYKFRGDQLDLKGYEITPRGKDFLRKAKQTSKYLLFGMLSMEKNNKEMHCKRRALLLNSILRKRKTIEEIYNYISSNNIDTTKEEIFDDILSLMNIGLNIIEKNSYTTSFAYQFVVSFFNNPGNKIDDINKRTKSSGTVINAENLLCLVDKILSTKTVDKEIFELNKEIII